MNTVNYQAELERIITAIDAPPQLLLHSCCAPCSSYVLEFLAQYFCITILFYNPNIAPQVEYDRRLEELRMLIPKMELDIPIIEVPYAPTDFTTAICGKSQDSEGGDRCKACYTLRLRYAAEYAAENNFDYFTTTLTISPHKNSAVLNEIGQAVACGVPFLPSDFKKKNGYKRSLALSSQLGLYRQNYCGCGL